jgi:hypothetical protein
VKVQAITRAFPVSPQLAKRWDTVTDVCREVAIPARMVVSGVNAAALCFLCQGCLFFHGAGAIFSSSLCPCLAATGYKCGVVLIVHPGILVVLSMSQSRYIKLLVPSINREVTIYLF